MAQDDDAELARALSLSRQEAAAEERRRVAEEERLLNLAMQESMRVAPKPVAALPAAFNREEREMAELMELSRREYQEEERRRQQQQVRCQTLIHVRD